jgi:DNA-binding transcriptional LysR family regulator
MQFLQLVAGGSMDLRRLAHIVALAERRNFARASEQVHLSQPALTRSIQAAEAELGLRLFDRGSTQVTPTPAGEFVLERARRLVFDGRCLKRDVELYREGKLGDTAFGVGPFPAATFLATLLASLRREFAQIALRVEVSNWERLLGLLLGEDIEFFVADTRELPHDPRLVIKAVRREPGGFYVRSGHPLAGRRSAGLREVWAHGVASVRLPRSVGTALARLLELAPHAPLPIALECDDVEILKKTALASDLVLGAPQAAVEAEVQSGALRKLRVTGLPAMFSTMGIVTLRGRTLSPMAGAIIERLKAMLG